MIAAKLDEHLSVAAPKLAEAMGQSLPRDRTSVVRLLLTVLWLSLVDSVPVQVIGLGLEAGKAVVGVVVPVGDVGGSKWYVAWNHGVDLPAPDACVSHRNCRHVSALATVEGGAVAACWLAEFGGDYNAQELSAAVFNGRPVFMSVNGAAWSAVGTHFPPDSGEGKSRCRFMHEPLVRHCLRNRLHSSVSAFLLLFNTGRPGPLLFCGARPLQFMLEFCTRIGASLDSRTPTEAGLVEANTPLLSRERTFGALLPLLCLSVVHAGTSSKLYKSLPSLGGLKGRGKTRLLLETDNLRDYCQYIPSLLSDRAPPELSKEFVAGWMEVARPLCLPDPTTLQLQEIQNFVRVFVTFNSDSPLSGRGKNMRLEVALRILYSHFIRGRVEMDFGCFKGVLSQQIDLATLSLETVLDWVAEFRGGTPDKPVLILLCLDEYQLAGEQLRGNLVPQLLGDVAGAMSCSFKRPYHLCPIFAGYYLGPLHIAATGSSAQLAQVPLPCLSVQHAECIADGMLGACRPQWRAEPLVRNFVFQAAMVPKVLVLGLGILQHAWATAPDLASMMMKEIERISSEVVSHFVRLLSEVICEGGLVRVPCFGDLRQVTVAGVPVSEWERMGLALVTRTAGHVEVEVPYTIIFSLVHYFKNFATGREPLVELRIMQCLARLWEFDLVLGGSTGGGLLWNVFEQFEALYLALRLNCFALAGTPVPFAELFCGATISETLKGVFVVPEPVDLLQAISLFTAESDCSSVLVKSLLALTPSPSRVDLRSYPSVVLPAANQQAWDTKVRLKCFRTSKLGASESESFAVEVFVQDKVVKHGGLLKSVLLDGLQTCRDFAVRQLSSDGPVGVVYSIFDPVKHASVDMRQATERVSDSVGQPAALPRRGRAQSAAFPAVPAGQPAESLSRGRALSEALHTGTSMATESAVDAVTSSVGTLALSEPFLGAFCLDLKGCLAYHGYFKSHVAADFSTFYVNDPGHLGRRGAGKLAVYFRKEEGGPFPSEAGASAAANRVMAHRPIASLEALLEAAFPGPAGCVCAGVDLDVLALVQFALFPGYTTVASYVVDATVSRS